MKTSLRLAMDNVDEAGERAADELIALNGVVYRAEVHPDISAMAQQQREDDERCAAEQAEHGMKAAADEAALNRSEALADAFSKVSSALVRGGHDPRRCPPAAALYNEAIGNMLLAIQNADRTVPDYSATSSAGEIARGTAVGAILGASF
jgi:hypothetical protein